MGLEAHRRFPDSAPSVVRESMEQSYSLLGSLVRRTAGGFRRWRRHSLLHLLRLLLVPLLQFPCLLLVPLLYLLFLGVVVLFRYLLVFLLLLLLDLLP